MSHFFIRKLEYQELVEKPRDWILKAAQAVPVPISLPCSTIYRDAARIAPTANLGKLQLWTNKPWLRKLRVWQPWNLISFCSKIKARIWSIFPGATQFPSREHTSSNDRGNPDTLLVFFFGNFPAEELLWHRSVPSAKGWWDFSGQNALHGPLILNLAQADCSGFKGVQYFTSSVYLLNYTR